MMGSGTSFSPRYLQREGYKTAFGMDWCVAVLPPMHLQREKYICKCKAVVW